MKIHRFILISLLSALFLASVSPAGAQSTQDRDERELSFTNLYSLDGTIAISGYEKPLGDQLALRLAAFHPQIDNLGDIVITLGTGSPHRLLVTGIDEPGFVVSAITDDGYLRVQRLPQNGLTPMFNELYSAQPVKGWYDGTPGNSYASLARRRRRRSLRPSPAGSHESAKIKRPRRNVRGYRSIFRR